MKTYTMMVQIAHDVNKNSRKNPPRKSIIERKRGENVNRISRKQHFSKTGRKVYRRDKICNESKNQDGALVSQMSEGLTQTVNLVREQRSLLVRRMFLEAFNLTLSHQKQPSSHHH